MEELKKKDYRSYWHHYLRLIPLDFSLRPYRSHTYHFSQFFFLVDPTPFQHPYLGFTPLDSTRRPDRCDTLHP
jgi:hypothetical protein